MVDINKNFKLYSPLIKSNGGSQDYELILEGVASTTSTDLEGDYVTPECIESMKEQTLHCNIHASHIYGLDDIIGTVLEVLETDENTLRIRFNVLPSFKFIIIQDSSTSPIINLSYLPFMTRFCLF